MNIGSSKKCPLCKKTVKLINGRYACEKCGYVINDSNNNVSVNTTQSTYTVKQTNTVQNTTPVNKSAYTPAYNPYNSNNGKSTNYTGKNSSSKIAKVITAIVILGWVIPVIVAMFSAIKESNEDDTYVVDTYNSYDDYEYNTDYEYDIDNILDGSNIDDIYDDLYDDLDDDTDDDWYNDFYNDEVDEEHLVPKTSLYQDFATNIFGKSYDTVTSEEYATITYLHVYMQEDRIDYAINDGEIMEYYYSDSLYGDIDTDIKCFTGLKTLNVEYDSFYYDDSLAGLTELTEVWCGNTIEELATWIENPEKIVSLGLEDSWGIESLAGVENFPNITTLYVLGSGLESLEGLDKLTNLKELTLDSANSLSNYTELSKLTNLEKLSIESNKIKNLAFLENMTNLKELSLSDTLITDASVIGDFATTLTKLELNYNYDLKNVSFINNLSNLQELTLYCNYEMELPNFSKLTNLKNLYLISADDITKLSDAKSLNELTLKSCDMENISVLKQLSSLKKLKIESSYSYFDNFADCMPINSLEVLDLNSLSIYGNIDAIFALPNIKEIYLQDSSIGIDVSKITTNNSLEILNMNNVEIEKHVLIDEYEYYSYYDYEPVDVNEISAMFGNFTGLKELYISNIGIENIDFASSLTNLEKIDISDNNISALKPLSGLANLQYVWCASNTISDADTLSENVQLIFEENY